MEKSCEQCGQSFTPKRKEQRFCCLLCSGRWVAEHRPSMAGQANPRYGKQHTEESKARIRAAHLGRKHSVETRAKMSEAHIGKAKSEAWRNNISLALKASSNVRNAGGENPNFITGEYVDERYGRRLVTLDACAECGATEHLEVHHKDGNHLNNRLKNLKVLCKRCHGKHHGRPKKRRIVHD